MKTQNCIKLWSCPPLLFSLSISLFSLSKVLREIENYASNEVGACRAVGRARLAMARWGRGSWWKNTAQKDCLRALPGP